MTLSTTHTRSEPRHAGVRIDDRRRGLILIVASAIAFGAAGVCGKAALLGSGRDLDVMHLTQFRITGAALVLQLIATVVRRRPGAQLTPIRWDRATVALVVVYGLVAFVGIQALYFLAISRMPVGIALLIEYLAPALVALWAVFVQRRRQPVVTWAGVGLTLIGLVLIARPWDGFVLDGIGVTAALVAALALTAYFLMADSAGDRMPALDLCAWASTAGAVALAIVLPWWTFPFRVLSRHARMAGTDVPVWLLLTIVVLVATVFAYVTGIAALAYLPAPVVAVLATLEVLVASVSAWILLGERLTLTEIAGGAVLLVGAVLAQLRRSRNPIGPETTITP